MKVRIGQHEWYPVNTIDDDGDYEIELSEAQIVRLRDAIRLFNEIQGEVNAIVNKQIFPYVVRVGESKP
jgi:hypothetical protein